ncbi:ABC transporter ATP-binding protein [Mesorhizobium sp. L-8-3]|uniref:ABC transporter ATP-binding protein n=1 Tax=Mesorhizobium sp. L-8-3 TaxID=2744522 RepID=UPI0019282EF1|nr:ABC transporter ATP-binding protein [Mesorhizobium sp. L-8-3]BCH23232.1 spermidine/putrescine ABC transporter [Mesorhizobium sp. L-8-3]
MRQSIVRLERVTKEFPLPEGGTIAALKAIDLDVARNEFLTLLGPSGCGKTTLLHAISGFVELDGGKVSIDGEDVTQRPPHRRPVNTVFQNYALFPHMSVGDNVGYALDIAGTARDERNRRVGEALERVGLAGLQGRQPRQLSGGQQQRVALARASPKLLLLDEPLSALDRNLRQAMQIELKTLQAELGISFIFVTHDQEEALTMSNRVAVLDKGSIQQIDTPREVYNHPGNSFVARFVGASNLFPGTVRRRDAEVVELASSEGDLIRAATKSGGGPAEGKTVTALIRPEQFSISDAANGRRSAQLDIDVEQVVFTGSNFEIHGRTRPGKKVLAIIAAAHQEEIARIEASRSARLAYDPAAVHLIDAAETAS